MGKKRSHSSRQSMRNELCKSTEIKSWIVIIELWEQLKFFKQLTLRKLMID